MVEIWSLPTWSFIHSLSLLPTSPMYLSWHSGNFVNQIEFVLFISYTRIWLKLAVFLQWKYIILHKHLWATIVISKNLLICVRIYFPFQCNDISTGFHSYTKGLVDKYETQVHVLKLGEFYSCTWCVRCYCYTYDFSAEVHDFGKHF